MRMWVSLLKRSRSFLVVCRIMFRFSAVIRTAFIVIGRVTVSSFIVIWVIGLGGG